MPDYARDLPKLKNAFPFLYGALRGYDPATDVEFMGGVYAALHDAWRADPADPVLREPPDLWSTAVTDAEDAVMALPDRPSLVKRTRTSEPTRSLPSDDARLGYIAGVQAIGMLRKTKAVTSAAPPAKGVGNLIDEIAQEAEAESAEAPVAASPPRSSEKRVPRKTKPAKADRVEPDAPDASMFVEERVTLLEIVCRGPITFDALLAYAESRGITSEARLLCRDGQLVLQQRLAE